ncbi:uncharacterized protein LOC129592037 isoform X1 [Paramacrobiotus metropolitanus]|uniref:uncharacterized protein LOC129592037 isoform X1 n=1 Tax=Paramacrobiotus metropolitanus TaxID=2943436 RepID=UPI002445E7A2|nr:uncharacterized protein LOC129592037 isoform X1 [Paramacrobiotus metropolitanus]
MAGGGVAELQFVGYGCGGLALLIIALAIPSKSQFAGMDGSCGLDLGNMHSAVSRVRPPAYRELYAAADTCCCVTPRGLRSTGWTGPERGRPPANAAHDLCNRSDCRVFLRCQPLQSGPEPGCKKDWGDLRPSDQQVSTLYWLYTFINLFYEVIRYGLMFGLLIATTIWILRTHKVGPVEDTDGGESGRNTAMYKVDNERVKLNAPGLA